MDALPQGRESKSMKLLIALFSLTIGTAAAIKSVDEMNVASNVMAQAQALAQR